MSQTVDLPKNKRKQNYLEIKKKKKLRKSNTDGKVNYLKIKTHSKTSTNRKEKWILCKNVKAHITVVHKFQVL